MIAVYIRVSSATQVKDGYSLQTQKERLTSFCKANGWDDYKFYVEEGRSAKNDKRPEYQKMMKDVKDKKVNTVLVYRLDRIMRSIGDLHDMLQTFEEYECSFKSATEPFDTTNATGKLFIYIVGALAQWENELKSERIKEVLEEKVANEGVWIGNVPYPFDLNEETNKLIPNEERKKHTLKMIDLFKRGYSSLRISDYMEELTGRTWHHNKVLRIIRNPALCGDTTWVDKTYEDTHKGIISRKEYNHVQEILKDRFKGEIRTTKSICVFQGKIVCPQCNKIMTVQRYYRKRQDGTEKEGALYRCNRCLKNKVDQPYPSEESLLKALNFYVKDINLHDLHDVKVDNKKPDYIKRLEVIENKRSKYQRAWGNDLMTDEEFKTRMEETRERYEELKKLSDEYEEPKPIDPEAIKNIVAMFNDNFNKLTKKEKREFVSMFFKSIEYEAIPQKPKNPSKSSKGRNKVVIKKINFYA